MARDQASLNPGSGSGQQREVADPWRPSAKLCPGAPLSFLLITVSVYSLAISVTVDVVVAASLFVLCCCLEAALF